MCTRSVEERSKELAIIVAAHQSSTNDVCSREQSHIRFAGRKWSTASRHDPWLTNMEGLFLEIA